MVSHRFAFCLKMGSLRPIQGKSNGSTFRNTSETQKCELGFKIEPFRLGPQTTAVIQIVVCRFVTHGPKVTTVPFLDGDFRLSAGSRGKSRRPDPFRRLSGDTSAPAFAFKCISSSQLRYYCPLWIDAAAATKP